VKDELFLLRQQNVYLTVYDHDSYVRPPLQPQALPGLQARLAARHVTPIAGGHFGAAAALAAADVDPDLHRNVFATFLVAQSHADGNQV